MRALFDAVARRFSQIWLMSSEATLIHRAELQAVADRYYSVIATIDGHLAADRLDEAMDLIAELRLAREEHNALCREGDETISPVATIQLAGRIAVRLRRPEQALSEPSPERLAA